MKVEVIKRSNRESIAMFQSEDGLEIITLFFDVDLHIVLNHVGNSDVVYLGEDSRGNKQFSLRDGLFRGNKLVKHTDGKWYMMLNSDTGELKVTHVIGKGYELTLGDTVISCDIAYDECLSFENLDITVKS